MWQAVKHMQKAGNGGRLIAGLHLTSEDWRKV